MFTNNKAKYYGDNKVLIDSACLSSDTKPTTGVANGSKCIEMDTGKTFMFNEEDSEWEELPSSGGGGGGSSDFSTAEVTFSCTSGSYTLILPIIEENQPIVVNDATVRDQPVTRILPLHAGALYISLDQVSDHYNPSCTGGVTYDEDNWRIAITGDGTFTAKGES